MSLDHNFDGPALCVEVVSVDGKAVLLVRGELDIATAPRLWALLCERVPELPPKADVVLDVGHLEFIDAAGLAVIVRLSNELRPEGRRLWVDSARPWTRRIFEITGLDWLLLRSETMEPVE